MNVGALQAKLPEMNNDGRPIINCFRTVDLVAIEPVWRVPEQVAFTRAEILRTISDYLGRYGGKSG